MNGKSLHELFEERAAQWPARIAVSCNGEEWTYADLNAQANALADALLTRGVLPGSIVGLYIDQRADLVVGLLGILKAGAAYLPLDPAYPQNRINWMLENSGVQVLVSVSRIRIDGVGDSRAIVQLDDLAAHPGSAGAERAPARPEDAAYVIYTSGSTGRPKGVIVEHRNVVRLFAQTARHFEFTERDVWCLFHSAGFDFSVWEIWGALLFGGRLAIVPFDISRSPSTFRQFLEANAVTVLNQTPSAFRNLIAADGAADSRLASLRHVVLGGERLDLSMLRPWFRKYGDSQPRVSNMYGITETTVHVTHRTITERDLNNLGVSPIGTPIADLRVHVLDDHLQSVPNDVPGEMFIEGAGLARGYLNDPALTQERFLEMELFGSRVRLYRTGDLAHRDGAGQLFYLGRSDNQIKVRGFRIEPQEIEAHLVKHPCIWAAVVESHDFGDADVRLVAYLVLESSTDRSAALERSLREWVAEELPIHMRPSLFRYLDRLPLTEHGKIDRAALRRHVGSAASGKERETVVEICERILQRDGFTEEDDFFDIGGTSLALLRLLSELGQRFGVTLETRYLVEGVTLRAIGDLVRTEEAKQLAGRA